MTTPHQVLKKYWGYESFRPGQEKIITSIISGKDTIAVMPTGAGKSICFQVPALLLPGITIVVSPLISLMQDQVLNAQKHGIAATFLNSSLSNTQKAQREKNIQKNTYTLLYVSPEKVTSASFQKILKKIVVSLIVIDEAHCISTWGKNFRPEYMKIAKVLKKRAKKPIIQAVTATATRAILTDISKSLELQSPNIISLPAVRDNLSLQVLKTPTTVIKLLFLIEILQKHHSQDGIIYTATQKAAEYVAKVISSLLPQRSVSYYHGGLSSQEREEVQSNFITGKISLIAATNAFGMGVDKPNIRFVIHFDTPLLPENYAQEIGRAGRDRKPATCYTFYSETDRTNQLKFLKKNSTYLQKRELNYKAHRMKDILQSKKCKTKTLAKYFNTQTSTCWNCSSCLSKKKLKEELTQAIDPSLFYALKHIRSHTHSSIPAVSRAFIATLKPPNCAHIPGLGTAFKIKKKQIAQVIIDENDKIRT